MTITTGRREPDVQWSISCMYARPWEEVAVKTRAPVAEAAATPARAECSDSTRMNRALSRPSATISESSSTMVVWGVMG